MKFEQVTGQKGVKSHFFEMVKSGRVSHALLLHGTEGAGNLPMALAIAQFIICTDPKENDSCGECKGCQKASRLIHPDIHFVFPVNTSDKIKTDPISDDYLEEWRNLVNETPYFSVNSWYRKIGLENKQGLISKKESENIIKKLNLKSFESDSKVMIIWYPEKMNRTSSNMLLKLIEEPPQSTFFLFVSDNPQDILSTIQSRIQPMRLSPIDDDSLLNALSSKYFMPAEQIKDIVRLSRGSMVKAIELINSSEENEYNFEQFTNYMRLCWGKKIFDLNVWVDEMHAIGRERLKSFFLFALRMIRENFIMNLKDEKLVYLNTSEKQFSEKFSPFINGRNVTQIYNELNQAYLDIESNGYAKIILMDLTLKMVKLIRQ